MTPALLPFRPLYCDFDRESASLPASLDQYPANRSDHLSYFTTYIFFAGNKHSRMSFSTLSPHSDPADNTLSSEFAFRSTISSPTLLFADSSGIPPFFSPSLPRSLSAICLRTSLSSSGTYSSSSPRARTLRAPGSPRAHRHRPDGTCSSSVKEESDALPPALPPPTPSTASRFRSRIIRIFRHLFPIPGD